MKKNILLFALILSAFTFSAFAQNQDNSGRVFWRGTIDDVARISVKGTTLTIQTVSGRSYDIGNFSFTAPLPETFVTVGVNKKEGRGDVAVVQQPTGENNYTAIVEVKDLKGGPDDYHLEIFWQ